MTFKTKTHRFGWVLAPLAIYAPPGPLRGCIVRKGQGEALFSEQTKLKGWLQCYLYPSCIKMLPAVEMAESLFIEQRSF